MEIVSLWTGDLGWQYPGVIGLAVFGAIVVTALLLRAAGRPPPPAAWECRACGARFGGERDERFRYCSYCGTGRNERYRPSPAEEE